MHVLQAGDNVIQLRFFPDGQRLLAGVATENKVIRFDVWTVATGGRVPLSLPKLTFDSWWWYAGYGNMTAIHPGGERCYVAGDGHLYACRTADGALLPVPKGVKAHQVAISPDGEQLVTAHRTDKARHLYSLRTDGKDGVVSRRTMPQSFRQLVGFLPDGNRLVTIDDAIRIGTVAGAEEATSRGKLFGSSQPQLSPDGRHLGMFGYHSMYIFEVPALGKPRRISGTRSSGDFEGFAFHPNGRTLVVIHGGPTLVKVYDLATLKLAHKYNWKLGPLGAVAYSPDGTLAAAGSRDGRIVVWDVDE